MHTVLSVAFGCVWLWHLTADANQQPIASNYGWFFNYVTFLPLSFQALQFPLCIWADIAGKGAVVTVADDFSSAIFGMAALVSATYYGMQLTMGNLEEPKKVPGWLPRMLHEGNSAAAIIDLLLAHKHRTFSWRASSLTALSLAAYCSWLPHSFHVNGSFPYPFMEKVKPQSWQYAAFCAYLLLGSQITFALGARVSGCLRSASIASHTRQH